MSVPPVQFIAFAVQLLILLGGAIALARILAVPALRARVFGRSRLAPWAISGPEVVLLLLMFFLFGMIGQGAVVSLFRDGIAPMPDKPGLEVALYGFGFHGFALLAWPAFHAVRAYLHADYGAEPPALAKPPRLAGQKVVVHGMTTLLLALPVLALASAAWTILLRLAGLSEAPQDLIAIFGSVQSPWVLVAMLVVACVVAPVSEELIFRGVIFRFCRQRFGRMIALVVSSVAFGALHGNWAGFLPLALLGAALAIAYERTGDLRVPILAHGLFNLNTTLVVLSGLVQT